MKRASVDVGITAAVEQVKPATAEEWLGKNTHNRIIRKAVVEAYARDMAAGKWRLSGEAIKFTPEGVLLDGQHRLHAIIKADVPVWMLVVRGIDSGAQEVMDTGAARSAGDALRLRGDTGNYTNLAAAARMAIIYESGRLRSMATEKITHSEILAFIDANSDLRYAADLAASWRKAIDIPVSLLTIAIWRLQRIDTEDCLVFFNRLATKTNMRAGDPVLALLNRLTEIRRNSRRLARADYLSLIFRAWNYDRTNKTVASLPVWTSTGAVDVPEPR